MTHEPPPQIRAGRGTGESQAAMTVYILYLIGVFIPVLSVVGVIIALATRGDAPDWVRTHQTYQIHTFFKALLFYVGAFAILIFMGVLFWLGLVAIMAFVIARSVRGLQRLSRREAIPDPATWSV
ncbi:MAG: hypothetical protein HXY25_00055 [Alphaproteobacteria bacterium]|nr:hypothetical protein [Alphaproteobacteria bacterium]